MNRDRTCPVSPMERRPGRSVAAPAIERATHEFTESGTHHPPGHPRLRRIRRRVVPADRRALGHRHRHRVDSVDRSAGRGWHLHPPQPRPQAQLLLRRQRPHGRRARGGAHLHLLSRRTRRRPHQQLDGSGGDEGHPDGAVRRLHARPDDVRHPVRDGQPRRRPSDVRGRDHRLGVRRGLDEDHGRHRHRRPASDRGARRRLRARPALCRCATRAGPGRCPLAVQRHEVHHPLPRDPRDLVLRLGLWRQRPARQEVLRPADRLCGRARRGLDGRTHADPQADLADRRRAVHRRGVPQRLRQDQPGDAGTDDPWLEG